MGRKIAIVGTAPSFKDAPVNDLSWEIWGLNGTWNLLSRIDRFFEIHSLKIVKELYPPEYIEFLHNSHKKVYMGGECYFNEDRELCDQNKFEEFKDCNLIPIKEIIKFTNSKYFTNTVSYMIAMACMEKDVEEISIFGVDMAHSSEYEWQRPSCEKMIGFARGMGIKVTIHKDSELCKCTHLYGVQEPPAVFVNGVIDKKLKEQQEYKKDTELKAHESTVRLNMYRHAGDVCGDILKDKKDDNDFLELINLKIEEQKNFFDKEKKALMDMSVNIRCYDHGIEMLQYINQNWSELK